MDKPAVVAETGTESIVPGRDTPEMERTVAFRICEAHSEGVVVLIAKYCDDSGRAQPVLTATLDFLVDFTIRLAPLSTDRRSAIVELAVNTASEKIAEAHQYVKVKLSEKQFEYQVTAAISEVWESVVLEVEQAGLPVARDLASIAEGDESLREANDALSQQVEVLIAEKEQQSATMLEQASTLAMMTDRVGQLEATMQSLSERTAGVNRLSGVPNALTLSPSAGAGTPLKIFQITFVVQVSAFVLKVATFTSKVTHSS